MFFAHRGKIGRLPHALREELNRRLLDGRPAAPTLAWLNQQPEVRELLAAEFGGQTINAPNLSAWRRSGYREWLAEKAAREEAPAWEAAPMPLTDDAPSPAETLSRWLAPRYALAAREALACDGEEGWRKLREVCRDLVDLQRTEQRAERLRLQRGE